MDDFSYGLSVESFLPKRRAKCTAGVQESIEEMQLMLVPKGGARLCSNSLCVLYS